MINSRVLMSDARCFSNEQPINPYYQVESIDMAAAQQEHSQIRDMLAHVGVDVVQVPSPAASQDGVYTANWALVRDGRAVLSNLPNARRAEQPHARAVLESLGLEVTQLPDGLRFSGQGDALPCGDLLFCGSTYRSDPEAQAIVAETLGYRRVQLQTRPQLDDQCRPVVNAASGWPDSYYYDIDLALSVLRAPEKGRKGLIAYCPNAFVESSRRMLEDMTEVEKIVVSEVEAREAFACNLISTGDVVVMSANAPDFASELETHGFGLLRPEINELAKGGGYIRCSTLTLS